MPDRKSLAAGEHDESPESPQALRDYWIWTYRRHLESLSLPQSKVHA